MSSSTYTTAGVNGEPMLVMLPRNWKGDGTIPGVVFSHGHGGNCLEARQPELPMFNLMAVAQAIVDAGFPVISGDFGGNNWGNAQSITKVSAAVALLASAYGCKPNRVGFLAQSMGHLTAMNWVAQNLAKTAFVISTIGVADLADINTQSAFTASITTAYGAPYTNAAFGATYNPAVNSAAKYAGLKWLGFAGATDTVCPPAKTAALAAAIGAGAQLVSIPGGHAWEPLANISLPTVRAFLAANA